jgi:hypothetical protein
LQGNPLAGVAPTQQQSIPVTAAFSQAAIDDILNLLRLPPNIPLSVLAVELFNREALVIRGDQYFAELASLPDGIPQSMVPAGGSQSPSPSAAIADSAAAATAVRMESQAIDDPLGQQLGSQRILRVSPLTPVRVVC